MPHGRFTSVAGSVAGRYVHGLAPRAYASATLINQRDSTSFPRERERESVCVCVDEVRKVGSFIQSIQSIEFRETRSASSIVVFVVLSCLVLLSTHSRDPAATSSLLNGHPTCRFIQHHHTISS